jgi:hypothetical protein
MLPYCRHLLRNLNPILWILLQKVVMEMGQGQLEANKAQCTRNRDDFCCRMGQVAAQVKRGEDPNEKVRDLSQARKYDFGAASLIARVQEAACCHKTVDQLVRNAEAL